LSGSSDRSRRGDGLVGAPLHPRDHHKNPRGPIRPAFYSSLGEGPGEDRDRLHADARGEPTWPAKSLTTKDRIWRRGWDLEPRRMQKTKNLRDSHFLSIRQIRSNGRV
jgi:hypothetical protein